MKKIEKRKRDEKRMKNLISEFSKFQKRSVWEIRRTRETQLRKNIPLFLMTRRIALDSLRQENWVLLGFFNSVCPHEFLIRDLRKWTGRIIIFLRESSRSRHLFGISRYWAFLQNCRRGHRWGCCLTESLRCFSAWGMSETFNSMIELSPSANFQGNFVDVGEPYPLNHLYVPFVLPKSTGMAIWWATNVCL